jgi:NEDD8-activating enzyme E1
MSRSICVREEGGAGSRSPAHCIEYAHLIQWEQERAGDEFDADNEEHMRWVYEKALKRADHFGIQVASCF